MHESRYHPEAVFVTLTYDDEHLPPDNNLVPAHLALFLKRLRQAMARTRKRPAALRGNRLRFIACGEYGERTGRPHYHALLFGVGFNDQQTYKSGDQPLYNSPTLSALWRHGHAVYGAVTAASAAYVAGYTMKSQGKSHHDADGVVMHPPFFRCSTRPGIGAFYVHSYPDDFRAGVCRSNDHVGRVPRYYKKLLERDNPALVEEAAQAIFEQQRERVERDPERFTQDRLVAAEAVLKARKALTHKPTF